ncbi:hypothetical protein NP493_41g02064 [Ridgeia piscesae]|uniref:Heparan-alpha-glucosaminide N-acetyltransferase catalytic domain-containing protein n=1 Tax=Ridgeia piscesae TaxID=27915 RepID=A0AAD9PC99_RIDPI|nr:hypothetical protein NP493_41g02064 [Ridgeia piscesae]
MTAGSLYTHLREYGRYTLLLHQQGDTGNSTCSLLLQNSPPDSDLPVYVALGVCAFVSIMWVIMRYIRRRYMLHRAEVVISNEHLVNTDLGSPSGLLSHANSTPVILPRKRVRSLDAFRGLCIAVMVFVNYGGGDYWYFKHSAWNGLTVADLVFPWFTFIMGTSIALAFSSLLSRGVTRKQLAVKVLKRSTILFLLGVMLSNNGKRGLVRVSELRILGVLQRLALSYCAVGLMQVFFAHSRDALQETRWSAVRDLAPYWPEWLISLTILATHICLTLLMPKVYHSTVAYDPEGILGTLTSIFLCFLGLQGLIAGVLCKFSQNDGWIPCNKNLWSVSFILTLASMAFFIITLACVFIDIYRLWSGVPFYYIGMNSILIYVGHELLIHCFPVQFWVPRTHPARFSMELWGAILWAVVAYCLHRSGVYLAI